MSRLPPRHRFAPGQFVPLATVLVTGLALRLLGLSRNGFGNTYYSAAVLSMSQSLHNFFYNAFDPAGILAVDKPPVALWVQVASVRLFGFEPLSLLLPQVLEGLAAIALVWHLVRRRYGAMPAFIAALLLAVTPISVAVDRSSNVDSCLVLVLLLAAWALLTATETGNTRRLMLALALVGIGFNVKMLAAFVVLPAFALTWWLGAPLRPMRRFTALAAAGAVCLAVSLAWVGAVEATPPADRPYVDSSPVNSMLDLVVDHNALQRFIPRTWRRPAPAGAMWHAAANGPDQRVPAGPLRLFDPVLASQVAWLLPLALIGGVSALMEVPLDLPLTPGAIGVVLWLAWLLAYAIVYSSAGGLFSAYYLVTMAPPLAALAAIGTRSLWSRRRAGQRRPLTAALVITGAWQAWLILPPGLADPADGVRAMLLITVAGGAVISTLSGILPRSPRADVAVMLGLCSLIVAPCVWSRDTAFDLTQGSRPVAALEAPAPGTRGRWRGAARAPQGLAEYLQARAGGMPFLAATSNARLAAPLIIATRAPVIAMGGFQGSMPVVTLPALRDLVSSGQLRYVLLEEPELGDRAPAGGFRRSARQRDIADWVRANATPVDPEAWRNPTQPELDGSRSDVLRLYDFQTPEPPAGTARNQP